MRLLLSNCVHDQYACDCVLQISKASTVVQLCRQPVYAILMLVWYLMNSALPACMADSECGSLQRECQECIPFVGKHLFEKLMTAKPPGFNTLCISWKISYSARAGPWSLLLVSQVRQCTSAQEKI